MKLSELLYRAAVLRASQEKKEKKAQKKKKRHVRKSTAGLVWIPNKIRKKFAGASR